MHEHPTRDGHRPGVFSNIRRSTRYWFTDRCAGAWLRVRDGFERACGRQILKRIQQKGDRCRIHGPIRVVHPQNLVLGHRVRIGIGCHFFAYGGLKIGDNTSISRYVTIYTANHNMEGDAIPYDSTFISKPVVIGRHVWIGMHVRITPGVTIGDGAVIGLGTVVSKDVPAGAIVVGSSSRIVGHRDMEHFAQLEQAGRFYSGLPADPPEKVDFTRVGTSPSDPGQSAN